MFFVVFQVFIFSDVNPLVTAEVFSAYKFINTATIEAIFTLMEKLLFHEVV